MSTTVKEQIGILQQAIDELSHYHADKEVKVNYHTVQADGFTNMNVADNRTDGAINIAVSGPMPGFWEGAQDIIDEKTPKRSEFQQNLADLIDRTVSNMDFTDLATSDTPGRKMLKDLHDSTDRQLDQLKKGRRRSPGVSIYG